MNKLFILLVTCFFSLSLHAENKEHDIDGYTTYEQALDALKLNPKARFSKDQGWIIANIDNDDDYIIWSFTPENHPSHPAVIKRKLVKKDDAIYIDMKGICDAEKSACDKLFKEFEKLNDKISQDMQPKI